MPGTSTSKISRAKAPSLTLTADQLNPSTGKSVGFTAAWTREVSPMSYHFDFGDGQSIDTQQLTADHAYSTAGTYTARVSGRAITKVGTMRPSPVVSNEVSIQVAQSPVERLSSGARKVKVPLGNTATVPSNPPPQETPTPPVLTLAADNQNPQPSQSVHFTGTWDRNVYRLEYLFDWGDGQTTGSREAVADHSYSQPGTYTVRVTASSISSTIAARTPALHSNQLLITVAQPPPPPTLPVLTLNADNLNPQTGDMVHFTGRWMAKFPPSRYLFDWGDGQTSETTELGAGHSYAAPGPYRVHVAATPLQSRRAAASSEIVSNELVLRVVQPPAPPPPVAAKLSLSADLVNPQPDQRVHFTAAFDQPVGSMGYRYVWGDGQSSDSESPEAYHSYSSAGTYKVHVLAKGVANGRSFGGQSNELLIAVATPPPPPPPLPPPSPLQPTATLNADQQSARVGDSIRFTASLNPQSAAVQYHFVFGDGEQQDSQTNQVVHSYARGGDFRPWVTVSLDGRDKPVTSPAMQLAISEVRSSLPPRLSVGVKSEKLLAGKDVVLQASLDPPHEIATYQFDWGDGSPPRRVGVNGVASHRYAQEGHYSVLVTASTEQTYPVSLQQDLILVISSSSWQPTLFEWILILAGAGVVVGVARRIYRKAIPPPEPLGLQVTAFSDAGVHAVKHVNPLVPHLSLTLKPGMDSANHEIIFPKRAAASD